MGTSAASPRTCTRCILDTSVPSVVLDESGLCSSCRHYDEIMRRPEYAPATRGRHLDRIVQDLKEIGRGRVHPFGPRRKYDCVIGLSGGADSSYAAYVAKRELGLRPLAVHVDNGWNSELAVKNIECLVKGLDLDLVTWVIDWEEFRGVQLSFLKAGVVDLELPSDHAIIAGLYHAARRHRIPAIVSGDNWATEATLPPGWNHRKTDLRNLHAINGAFERATLETFPTLSTVGMLFQQKVMRMRHVPLLAYVDYDKKKAIEVLSRELSWRPYGAKHFESIITRFYQGYILPTKFGIDKRRFHFSRLICSGQMTKEEALRELEAPPYDAALVREDKEYVAKKFGLSTAEFDRLMGEPPKKHLDYPSDERLLDGLFKTKALLKKAVSRFRPARG